MFKQSTETRPLAQAPWSVARAYERKSRDCIREALSLRGEDRFNALALGSTYALAARDAALMVGGAQ